MASIESQLKRNHWAADLLERYPLTTYTEILRSVNIRVIYFDNRQAIEEALDEYKENTGIDLLEENTVWENMEFVLAELDKLQKMEEN